MQRGREGGREGGLTPAAGWVAARPPPSAGSHKLHPGVRLCSKQERTSDEAREHEDGCEAEKAGRHQAWALHRV